MKLAPEVMEALLNSIQKWEDVVAGRVADEGFLNCALCQLFSDSIGCTHKTFGLCPVVEKTTWKGCRETPWLTWYRHGRDHHGDVLDLTGFWVCPDCPECKTLAQEELNFLKNLLPKKETNDERF